MPHVVSIQDPWYGGDESPGEYWGADDRREHCSPESLATVGVVTLAALRQISDQLEKIDGLSGRAERRRMEVMEPSEITGEEVEEPAPAPEAGEAPEAAPQPEAAPPAPGPETADPAPESS